MTQSRDPSTGKFLSNITSRLTPKQKNVLLLVHQRVTVCLIESIYGHEVTLKLHNKKNQNDKDFNPKVMFFSGQNITKQNVSTTLQRLRALGDEENICEIEKVFLDRRHYKSGKQREWKPKQIADVGADFLNHHDKDQIGLHEWYNTHNYNIAWSTFQNYMLIMMVILHRQNKCQFEMLLSN